LSSAHALAKKKVSMLSIHDNSLQTDFNENNGRESHENIDNCDTQRDVWSKIRKGLGEYIVAIVKNF